MSTQTTNYGLTKPDVTDMYDIAVFNDNADIIDKTLKGKAEQTEVEELKKSVSDGKTLVANAITSKGVATATDATFGTMATNINAIQTNPTLQQKSVALSTSAQTIKADSGYDGLSQVNVPAVVGTATTSNVLAGKTFSSASGVNLTGTMADNGAVNQSLNAGGSYTIPVGYHNGSGKVTGNSLASQTPGSATSAQILYGQTAWVGGSKLTGTMNNVAGQYASPVSMQMNGNLDIVPAQGYYNGSNAYVAITPSVLANAIGLTADKLVSGNAVLGINGSAKRYASGSGYTTIAYGSSAVFVRNDSGNAISTVSLNTTNGGALSVNIGLNWTPSIVKFTIVTSLYTFYVTAIPGAYTMLLKRSDAPTYYYLGYFEIYTSPLYMPINNGNTYYIPFVTTYYGTISSITWEAWE